MISPECVVKVTDGQLKSFREAPEIKTSPVKSMHLENEGEIEEPRRSSLEHILGINDLKVEVDLRS